eukprot:365736-Chlamydomonas_euryale.AAC.2
MLCTLRVLMRRLLCARPQLGGGGSPLQMCPRVHQHPQAVHAAARPLAGRSGYCRLAVGQLSGCPPLCGCSPAPMTAAAATATAACRALSQLIWYNNARIASTTTLVGFLWIAAHPGPSHVDGPVNACVWSWIGCAVTHPCG